VVGPCERDEIPEVEGFDADTLVCPEEQPGSYPRRWRRAAQIPDLSVYLLPSGAKPAAPGDAWGPLLPPDPTLSDVAEVNSLQEKVRLIANAVHLLRDEMVEQKAKIADLKDEVERKGQTLCETQLRLGEAEERLRSLEALRGEAVKAQEEFQAVKGRLAELDASVERQDEHGRRLTALELARGHFERGEDRLVELEKNFLKARDEAAAALSKAVGKLLSEIMSISSSRQAAAGLPPAKPPKPQAGSGEFGLPTLSLLDEGGLDTVDLFGEEGGGSGNAAPEGVVRPPLAEGGGKGPGEPP